MTNIGIANKINVVHKAWMPNVLRNAEAGAISQATASPEGTGIVHQAKDVAADGVLQHSRERVIKRKEPAGSSRANHRSAGSRGVGDLRI